MDNNSDSNAELHGKNMVIYTQDTQDNTLKICVFIKYY